MLGILLTVLKIIGIVLLVLLGIVLLILGLVLFVPIRYRLDAHRDLKEQAPVVAAVKATWLLRLLGVFFTYPDAAYVNVKLLGISIYRSDKEQKPKKEKKTKAKGKQVSAADNPEDLQVKKEQICDNKTEVQKEEMNFEKEETFEAENLDFISGQDDRIEDENQKQDEKPSLKQFFLKLWEKIKNIKYTIRQICDKIKHIVKNIRYYLKVIQSDTFKSAFSLCSAQLMSLLKSIRPRKVKGELTVGTGDPASTGQILAIYGMLYPVLGNNISVTPDFENQIIEGNLLVKGRITLFQAVKVAFILFFNKDIKRVIRLFKREVK